MELWIRSQDKKVLIKTDYIEFGEWNNEYRIYINAEICGKYKSKERALEVLDEIQDRLITLCDSMNRHLYVYEMPKE